MTGPVLTPEDPRRHLLAAMSHELRTPLNLVIGFADALAREPGRPEDAIRADAHATLEAARQLMAAVNTVLEITHVTQGLLELSADTIDLASLLDASGHAVATLAQRAGVRLDIRMPAGRIMLRGDEKRLRQVLEQLLAQAIAATARGGLVTLTVTHDPDGALRLVLRDAGTATSMGLDLSQKLVRAHSGHLALADGTATLTLPSSRLTLPSLSDQLQDLT